MALSPAAPTQPGAEQKQATPSISLPKGGGAIRGIGEKFAANPVTGTGSMSVPLATSPGRSGFGPQLSLSYDSGAGNSPFGLGWSLSVSAITRKTDKGLPQYRDADESDVYILSGAEDLVPVLQSDGTRFKDNTSVPGYVIHRYRPRIEGLFARIERWTDATTGEIHWRSISRDNITSLYGRTNESRIFDPADPDPEHPTRIFAWLICQSFDDKGNAILYQFRAEDSQRIFENPAGEVVALARERNRHEATRSANRYVKRIRYGNREPNRDQKWEATDPVQLPDATWMFDVVFDYGEGHYSEAVSDADARIFVRARPDLPTGSLWPVRQDPFSVYRAGFEVRTYRLCRRVLVFHRFAQELGIDDCLVRSTEFSYAESPVASFITSISQSGYLRQPTANQPDRYLKKSLPPLEFEYSKVPSATELAQQLIRELDPDSLANLPIGLDGGTYQWVDLDGEGTSGILSEHTGGWYYKRNESPNNVVPENGHQRTLAKLGAAELVRRKPVASLGSGGQFLDLAGDGQLDLVQMEGPLRGFYERTEDGDWSPFQSFKTAPDLSTRDLDVKFIDLTGDGHADILVTESETLTWYPSLAEEGFGPPVRIHLPTDEEKGPRLVFADGAKSIYLADFSGDGLSDLVRIRNGEICFWPNLGYGRFGAKVTMDHAPWFDHADQFDQRHIRLADTDGSGTTDILYFGRAGGQIYFNQSGNRWSEAVTLPQFPSVDNISGVQALDLLGNGTACLAWSSPLPSATGRPMRYLALMDEKPHLLIGVKNNLGAETRIRYAPSTRFYLEDEYSGRPWITRLPFPVHVVERVETCDLISRNYFATRYAYHHGYFDGVEREFRGFGMVEQWDTAAFGMLAEGGMLTSPANFNAASNVPPVRTKTWFHTGAHLNGEKISQQFAHEYFDAPKEGDSSFQQEWKEFEATLLADTILVPGLTADEDREACRALKGSILRREVYALDGTSRETLPYEVTEQNFTMRALQRRGDNRHAVFFTHPREVISYHTERDPSDPRVTHALTLEVDAFGNVLKSADIGYGRLHADEALPQEDQKQQTRTLLTYSENRVTNPIDGANDYRTPLPAETRTYELTGYAPTGPSGRFQATDFVKPDPQDAERLVHVFDSEIPYEQQPTSGTQRRLIERVRTVYRRNDLTVFLGPGQLQSLAIPGESYRLAFTPGLLGNVFKRNGQALLPDATAVLGAKGGDGGAYVDLDGDGRWWIPSGRVFLSPNNSDPAAQELAHARQHFFLPRRFRDPFHTDAIASESIITYDGHNLLMVESRDPLGNRVTAGERKPDGTIDSTKPGNDYRVLQPRRLMDANRNRAEVAFDALGMVVGTAVRGKPEETMGDLLDAFEPDLTDAILLDHLQNPLAQPNAILGRATTRLLYDLFAYQRTKKQAHPQPAVVCSMARETHDADLEPGLQTKVQHSFTYSDGFGREIQKKIQAEPGPVPQRDANGDIIIVALGQPLMTTGDVTPRWVGSGWTVFNNKGKPVRQYEPFFTDTHRFEFDVRIGVSPILFYDPLDRVVGTSHPNHSWEKVVFDPWRQETWDVNDTALADPKTDADLGDFFSRLPDADYLPTWHAQRQGGALGSEEQDAANKAAVHAATPTVAHADVLGRTFLTVAHNKLKYSNTSPADPPAEEFYRTRVVLDIEGNQREVIDAKDRVVMRYDYDMLGNRIHQSSMEAGERWILNDVAGKPLYAWDSRDHEFRNRYDALRRPTDSFVRDGMGQPQLVGRTVYGEALANAEADNLRGKVVQVFDQAGVVTSEAYDFKGNLLRSRRQLAQSYNATLDWLTSVPLDGQTYTSQTSYDALNRPRELTTPDQSVVRPFYNEANLLERLDVNLRGAAAATPFVTDIDYDAKGRRTLIAHGNGVETKYTYDPLTYRLSTLTTTSAGTALQDLSYTYDPAGNITHINDAAQQAAFFDNAVVEPNAGYTYDAIYRLIEATGREHIGQLSQPQPTWSDEFRTRLLHPNDGQAMRRYAERYHYDQVGNFLEMIHVASNGNWTRAYSYQEASPLQAGKVSNRLSSTTVGDTSETYTYDAHGSMLQMLPHLPSMRWDFRDQLQQVDLGGGGTAFYVYDAAGQRLRKVHQHLEGTVEERIYLGGFEIYRKRNSSGVQLERETLHVMDGTQRVALVETRTQGTDDSLPQLIRYQFGNHLGSAALELDDVGKIISYEEFYPYGATSYQAVRSQTEVPAKRYRYTGKERDEETGLNYHGARYYAPWLGRWTSADPLGIIDHTNRFIYVRCNPMRLVDENGGQSSPRPKPKLYPGPTGTPDNPFNRFSDAPNPQFRENWEAAVNKVLEPLYKGGSYAENYKRFQDAIDRLPQKGAKGVLSAGEHARTMFDRALAKFKELEAAKPSYDYGGKEPLEGTQIHHDEEIKGVKGRETPPNPRRALDFDNLIATKGGKKGGQPKGSTHNYVHHSEAAKRLDAFRGKTPSSGALKSVEAQAKTGSVKSAAEPAKKASVSAEPVNKASMSAEPAKGSAGGKRGVASVEAMGGTGLAAGMVLVFLQDLSRARTSEERSQVLSGWLTSIMFSELAYAAMGWASVGLMTSGDQPIENEEPSSAPQAIDIPGSPPPTSVIDDYGNQGFQ